MAKIQTTRVYTEVEKAARQGYAVVSAQGSSRSSKTYNILIWLIARCLAVPGTTVSVCRATMPSIKASAMRDFADILRRMGVYDPKAFNKSEFIYTFPNGSWTEFFSCDSEQKLRGRKRQILYVNEANEIGFMEWQQLQLRTTLLSVIDYNPSFSDEHWICSVNADPRTYHFVTTYKDNPFLEQKLIDEIESLREKNESLWRIYGLGLQAQVEGLVFPTFTTVKEMPHGVTPYIGVDFGFTNDPTAIIRVAFQGGTMYLDEACYRTEMLTSDIIRELRAIDGQGGTRHKVIAESAEPRLIEEIYRAGIDIHPVRKYPGSVVAGLAKMQEYKLAVTERSGNLKKELRNYVYRQDKEGKWLNEPADAFNHLIDASRYVVLMTVLGGKKRPVDIRRLGKIVY